MQTNALLIDGQNLTHRTYWIAKQNRNNEDIGNLHTYMTLMAVKSYINEFKPAVTYVCWDEKLDYEVNDRRKAFADYKGNRSSDTSMHENNAKIQELLTELGIHNFFPRSLEADDCIAFLAATLDGTKVIVSVDKDFQQLVSPTVSLYNPIKKYTVTPATFSEHCDVPIDRFLETKCLTGDKSDNVPGIPKFGPVKVQKYLRGEVILTEDEIAIRDRNLDLFRLDKFQTHPTELQYYNDQLEKAGYPVSLNYSRFISLCKEYEFNKILANREQWYSTFFLGSKLQGLFK